MTKRHAYFSAVGFQAREEPESGGKIIEGYFAVFNQPTELWEGVEEEIAPGAFDNSLAKNDIRALFNHNSDMVLGRTGSSTLALKTDAHGLHGSVRINEEDKQALDVYARVKRGDIDGCSFGFWPLREEHVQLPGGKTRWRVLEADTREVSVCTFPAYPQTELQARQSDWAAQDAVARDKLRRDLKTRLEALHVKADQT